MPYEYTVDLEITRRITDRHYEVKRVDVTVYAHSRDEAVEMAIDKVMDWPGVEDAEFKDIDE